MSVGWAGAHLYMQGLALSVTCGQRTPRSWRWKEELPSPAGTVPWAAGGSQLHMCAVPGKEFSPGILPLKYVAFSHPF